MPTTTYISSEDEDNDDPFGDYTVPKLDVLPPTNTVNYFVNCNKITIFLFIQAPPKALPKAPATITNPPNFGFDEGLSKKIVVFLSTFLSSIR